VIIVLRKLIALSAASCCGPKTGLEAGHWQGQAGSRQLHADRTVFCHRHFGFQSLSWQGMGLYAGGIVASSSYARFAAVCCWQGRGGPGCCLPAKGYQKTLNCLLVCILNRNSSGFIKATQIPSGYLNLTAGSCCGPKNWAECRPGGQPAGWGGWFVMGYLRLALSGLEGTPGHLPAMVGLDATAGARGVGPSRAVGCGRCHRLIQGCT
jgi:hypothetical protein